MSPVTLTSTASQPPWWATRRASPSRRWPCTRRPVPPCAVFSRQSSFCPRSSRRPRTPTRRDSRRWTPGWPRPRRCQQCWVWHHRRALPNREVRAEVRICRFLGGSPPAPGGRPQGGCQGPSRPRVARARD